MTLLFNLAYLNQYVSGICRQQVRLLFFIIIGVFISNWSWGQTTRTWVPSGGGVWTVASNWSPSGAPAAGDNVVIDKAQSAAITGIPNTTLNGMSVSANCQLEMSNSNQTITLNGYLNVASGVTVSMGITNSKMNVALGPNAIAAVLGTLRLGASTPAGSLTVNGDLSVGPNGVISGASSFSLNAGATLRIGSSNGITVTGASGSIQVTGNRTFSTAAHYQYNGVVNQNTGDGLPTGLTSSLTIDNPNTVTLTGNRILSSGNLRLLQGVFAAGNQLSLGNSTTTISLILIRDAGSMTGSLQGANAYAVNYTGNNKPASAELSGPGLRSITINMVQGQKLSLNQNLNLPGVLTLTSGILETGSHTLVLAGSNPASLFGGSPLSFVSGNLQRAIAAGANFYLFPVGSSNGYAPVNLNFPADNPGGALLVNSLDGDRQDLAQTTLNAFRSVNRVWSISVVSGMTSGNYNANFEWPSSDEDAGFDINNAVVAKWSASEWSYPAIGSRYTSGITVTNISGNGDFQIGKSCLMTKVLRQPSGARICRNDAALLSVDAEGDGTLAYQWSKDEVDIDGANDASFSATGEGTYRVRVTGECRSDISATAVVAIKKATVINAHPQSNTRCAGDELSVEGEGDGLLSYQWMKDGEEIPGATASTFAVQEAGAYSVKVWGDCGVVASDIAQVDLYAPTEILDQPDDVEVTYGENTRFSVQATGTGTLRYKWQVAAADAWGDAIEPGAEPVTETEDLHLDLPSGKLDGNRFRVVVTGLCGDAVSRDAQLKVRKAPLFVISDDTVRTYGDANPNFTVKFAGFLNNEVLETSDLNGSPAFETIADEHSPIGEYAVVPVQGSLSSHNYQFEFVGSRMHIVKAPLVATVAPLTKYYGDPNPPLSVSFIGFKNNENAQSAGVEGEAILSTSAADSSIVGEYPIEVQLGTLAAPNYDMAAANSLLTVNKANLVVAVNHQTRIYGNANSPFTYTLSGFKKGETLETSGVTGEPVFTTTASPTSAVGEYEIIPDTGTLSAFNYDFTLLKGMITVNKAPLTVRASNLSKFYGNINPALSFTYNGFKNGEDQSSSGLSGEPVLSTTALQLSDVGQYPIRVNRNDLNADNYEFVLQNGVLSVLQAPCSATGNLMVTDSCFGQPIQLTFTSSTSDAGPFLLIINDSAYRDIQSGVPFSTGKIAEAAAPESIWPNTLEGVVPVTPDPQGVELGVKFRPNVAGRITGIRFYKLSGNTGTHTGSLWTATGTLLATATFTEETENGWQQVNFSTPITVTPGQVYVASYYAPAGNYAFAADVFNGKRVSNIAGSLTALSDRDGGNGLFQYGSGGFPTSVSGGNYYVDVVFQNTQNTARFNMTGVISYNGCALNAASIKAPALRMRPFIGLSIAKKDLDCVENNDGFITLSTVSCYPPLQYSIDSGSTYVNSNEFVNLGPGTYKVRIMDATGFAVDTTVSLNLDVAVWTGAINSDWHTAGNWNINKVPTASTHVIIPNTTNRCSLNANGVAASVQLEQGTQIRVLANRKLTMTGKCKELPKR